MNQTLELSFEAALNFELKRRKFEIFEQQVLRQRWLDIPADRRFEPSMTGEEARVLPLCYAM